MRYVVVDVTTITWAQWAQYLQPEPPGGRLPGDLPFGPLETALRFDAETAIRASDAWATRGWDVRATADPSEVAS